MRSVCEQCLVGLVREDEDVCRACQYKNRVSYMRQEDPDDQDWGFAHCDECGSSLDSEGICRSQSCGASPDVGIDWI